MKGTKNILRELIERVYFPNNPKQVYATSPTIMDKSLGTDVQFERFLTHAKLYPWATNTVRPYPLPPPHRQC